MSTHSKSNVAILGSTGSIGTASIEVISRLPEFSVWGLSAYSRLKDLADQARRFAPKVVVAACKKSWQALQAECSFPSGTEVHSGAQALVELAERTDVGIVIAAIVGSAGLDSTLAAAKSGKRIALANKEALVVAGSLVTQAVKSSGGQIIPVDSEHSAIFQAIHAGKPSQVKRIILTASGGPFRKWTRKQLLAARVEDALAHPTWQMGRKITIDSATMMNKALEIIEARWLFDLPTDKIHVMVHPQSIVHSMVEFDDGSVVAQLSPPDMRLPIQYSLTYPERLPGPCRTMDWSKSFELVFEPVDQEKFPAIELGWEVARRGGSSGAVLNAANEAAVELFLLGKIRFVDIVEGCRRILNEHNFDPNPTLAELLRLDQWSREEMNRWAAAC